MQRVLKRKITTIPYTTTCSQTWYENIKNRTTENARRYGRNRTQIEAEMQNRRESWKLKPPENPYMPLSLPYKLVIRNQLPPIKKDDDEPPPRGY
jgi:hypothetical protein